MDHKRLNLTNSKSITRRQVIRGATASGVVGLAGCTGNGSNQSGSNQSGSNQQQNLEEVNITLVTPFSEGDFLVDTANRFKEKMEKESSGAFTVEVITGGAYGGEGEVTSTLSNGGIDVQVTGPAPYFNYVGKYAFINSPFVMQDYDHLINVTTSDLWQKARQDLITSSGIRELGRFVYRGMRGVAARFPIRTPEEAQGMDLRMPGFDSWVTTWEGVGVNPTTIALNEVYSALDTGAADGTGADIGQLRSGKYFEVTSHFTKTRTMVGTGNIFINNDFFEQLSQAYQEMVRENATEATMETSEFAKEKEQEWFNQLEEDGSIKVIGDANVDAYRKAGRPAVKDQFEEDWASTYEEIMSLSEA